MPSTRTEPLPAPLWTGPESDGSPGPDAGGSALLAPWRLPLAQLLDSAAPTGTFSHSFGMETAIVTGDICDAGSAGEWLRCYLETSLEHNDALAIRLARVGSVDREGPWVDAAADRLCRLSALLEASTMSPEARHANAAIGRRMIQISGDLGITLVTAFVARAAATGVHPHPALVAAAVGCRLGAKWPEVCGLYLYSCLTSLVQNAVRAIPLGQIAGQQVLAGLAGPVAASVQRTARADPDDLGSSSPMLDVLQCEHETQLGRMFIS